MRAATSQPSMLVTEVPSCHGTVTTQCGQGAGHRQCAHSTFQLKEKSQGGPTPEGGPRGILLMDGFMANGHISLYFALFILFLEEEMAAHSGILAWRIPWTAEPGRLLSMGLHRVRHD